MNHIYQYIKHECLPPYTDTTFDSNDASNGAYICFNYEKLRSIELAGVLEDTPEIFKCYTGIVPYKCPELTNEVKIEAFHGYSFPDTSNTDCFYDNNDDEPANYRTNCDSVR